MGNKPSVAKPPVRRAAAKRPSARPRPSKAGDKAPRRAKPADDAVSNFSPDERQQLIGLGAYYRAETRGFDPGHELEDWLEAESEVDGVLHGRNGSPDSV